MLDFDLVLLVEEFPSTSQSFIVRKVKALAERGVRVNVVSIGRPQRPEHLELLAGLENARITYIPNDKGNRLQRALVWAYMFIWAGFTAPAEAYQFWKSTGRYGSIAKRLKAYRKLLGLIGIRGDIYHFEFGDIAAEYIDYLADLSQPCLVSFRGADIDIYPRSHPELKQVYARVIQNANRIHCVSQAIAEQAAKYGDRNKIFINRPAIDAAFFQPNSSGARDQNLVVSVTRLKWKKGLTYALLAIAKLAADFPDIRYVIVGDGPAREELQFYIDDLGLQRNVELRGWASADQVKSLLEKAAVFLLSSIEEGISNAVLEAMAMQAPVVVTTAGGIAEAVTDGVEGFVVPRYDPQGIAVKLATLLEDEALRNRMGQCGRERILRDFTIERQVEVFLHEYEMLLRQTGDTQL